MVGIFPSQLHMLERYLKNLQQRSLVEGGFTNRLGGDYRPDATAWAIIALNEYSAAEKLVSTARRRLLDDQDHEGRISISSDHPDSFWPTPLAMLAWHPSTNYQTAIDKAQTFLLETSGLHWEKTPEMPIGHDTAILGWPWMGNTHSWVAPTALAMMALKVVGLGSHPRVKVGAQMLLDRQLPHGGWNAGNTTVFGQELRPFPETTGAALNALAGLVPSEAISISLDYLQDTVSSLRTPVSLGWALHGLKAWSLGPSNGLEWIHETLERGISHNGYDTSALSVLLTAALAPSGLESMITTTRNITPAS